MDLEMESMASAIGVSVPVLRFLLCYGATIQVGLIHRIVRDRLAKHLYSFASGAILSYLLFGSSSILHFLVTMLVGYASMLLSRALCGLIKFMLDFGYLIGCHVYYMSGYAWKQGGIDATEMEEDGIKEQSGSSSSSVFNVEKESTQMKKMEMVRKKSQLEKLSIDNGEKMETVRKESQLEKLSIDNGDDEYRDAESLVLEHYTSSDKILLVGEGDFSFAVCLAKSFGSAANMVATSLDSEELVRRKYVAAAWNIQMLEDMDCLVVHNVNAHSMSKHPFLRQQTFDKIIYNFPHTALKWSEGNFRQIERHQRLVKGYLRSARKMVSEKGEVHITNKICIPYCWWEIESLAEEVGLQLIEKVKFLQSDYEGYQNKVGFGFRANATFYIGAAVLYKFAKRS